MISVLHDILCWVAAIGNAVLWALMSMVNLIIAGLGAAVAAAIALLPVMPTDPSWTGVSADVFSTANWFFPVGFLVLTLSTLAVLYVGWLLIRTVFHYGGFVE